uniref:Uncharacterized protein n=1 Tax=Solanum lycopersicum TaxID=4081 RepID=A0A3Q7E9M1_SOLLC
MQTRKEKQNGPYIPSEVEILVLSLKKCSIPEQNGEDGGELEVPNQGKKIEVESDIHFENVSKDKKKALLVPKLGQIPQNPDWQIEGLQSFHPCARRGVYPHEPRTMPQMASPK